MQSILFVVPGFEPCSAVSQALLAARGLLAHGWRLHAAGWDLHAFPADQFAAAGVVVHDLGRSRLLQVERFRRLLAIVRDVRPKWTIAWGMPSIRLASAVPGRVLGPWMAAHAFPIHPSYGGRLLDRAFLQRARRVLISTQAERLAELSLGLSETCLELLPPGIEPDGDKETSVDRSAGRYLLCIGPLEREKGIQDAIWTLEILKYVYEDLKLLIVGTGPDRERLEAFARAVRTGQSVQFLGAQPELGPMMSGAVALWITSRADRGVQSALEAMRAGVPVVASRTPRLSEVIVDGETGLLAPAGDKIAFAKQTRKLLDDPSFARKLGEAGRGRAREQFSRESTIAKLLEMLN